MPTSNSHACPRIGVLALQGTFSLHRQTLERLGVASREIREKADLASLDGLILPGGESSTMLKLMVEEDLFQPLVRFHRSGGALYGTCAGAILLAAEVENPNQESLGLLDIRIRRNALRDAQAESHVGELPCPALGEPALPLVMITRAGHYPDRPGSPGPGTLAGTAGVREAGPGPGLDLPSRTHGRHPHPPSLRERSGSRRGGGGLERSGAGSPSRSPTPRRSEAILGGSRIRTRLACGLGRWLVSLPAKEKAGRSRLRSTTAKAGSSRPSGTDSDVLTWR